MFILHEQEENTKINYISFIGDTSDARFDLAIIPTEHFYGKRLVFYIQSGRTAIVGLDDLEEPGFLEHAFNCTEAEANDLNEYLQSTF